MLLSTVPILRAIVFSTSVFSFAVPDHLRINTGNADTKLTTRAGECVKQGGLCAHAPCCKDSSLTCQGDGHGIYFCELEILPSRSKFETFYETLQKFRDTTSSYLGPIYISHHRINSSMKLSMKPKIWSRTTRNRLI